ncbi:heat shock 70 kDa protein 12B-like [Saccostrea echinata]|uniref:heat shock 70 kDa protein 12B-like n=1 Tax=Saccostrea echinata TaxID=191078 RepID=UPI002A832A78|nr:heat shock 70 kDa protein 12B-like [Saccostrea echinata]
MSTTSKLLVAAIDFGTTYSGYAFSFKHEYDNDPLKVSSNNWTAGSRSLVSLKTPTCVLFNKDKVFDSFGYEAEDKYSELAEEEEHEDWYFFKRFKMSLFNKEEQLTKAVKIKSIDGKEMVALDVFSAAIKFLRGHLLHTLENRATGVRETDIQWVLTVPAIWDDPAKQFMREAAVRAGISGDQLLIALEPEAASLYCKHLPVERLQSEGGVQGFGAFSKGSKYLVLDCGGGTVDITVHEVQPDLNLKELYKASGGAWGGTQVDEAYKQMLIKIVGAPIITEFSRTHTADYVDMYREFETKKRAITGDTKGKVTIKIPISLVETFEEDTGEDIKETIENTKFSGKITWVGDKCRITAEVIKSLFEVAGDQIVDHVKDLLKKPEISGTNNIIMVGGFSESPILQHMIKQSFPDMRVIIPPEAGLAVLKGAVLFGHKPATISSRIAKYTYGVATTVNFNPCIHPPEKKKKYGNLIKCIDIFSKHVEKGQTLKFGEAQSDNTYTPVEDDQTSMCFQIYTCTDLNPGYVTDPGCKKLGEMEVKMPDTSGGRNRSVTCEMIFGGTELEVKATIQKTGQVTQAKFNFLD